MKIPSSQVYVTLISTLRALFEGSEEALERWSPRWRRSFLPFGYV